MQTPPPRTLPWLVTVLLATPAWAAPVYSPYGMNAHLPNQEDVTAAAQAGLGWLRMDFNWFQMEPSRGNHDFTVQDAAVDAAVAAGLHVFVTLAYTPQWAAVDPGCTPGDSCNYSPFTDTADWTSFVTAVVTHFQTRVKVYGMWNEPNLGGFYGGTQTQYVETILVPGSAAVHAACADCLVAGPETSGLTASSSWNGDQGTCVFGQCIRNGWELDLGGVLDAAADSIDIVTQHFYNNSVQSVAVGNLCDGSFFGTTMTHDSLRGVLAAHHGAGKPVWLTETGIEAVLPSEEQAQADFVTQLLQAREDLAAGTYAPAMASHQPFVVDKIFFYDLRGDRGYGLLRDDGTPKLAVGALTQFIAAHPPVMPGASSSGSSSSSAASMAASSSLGSSSAAASSSSTTMVPSSSRLPSSSSAPGSSALSGTATSGGGLSVGGSSGPEPSSGGDGTKGCADAGTGDGCPALGAAALGLLLLRRKRG